MSIGERRPPLFENRNRGLSDEFVQEVVHEMKDELNGISVFVLNIDWTPITSRSHTQLSHIRSKTVVLRMNLNIDGPSIVSRSHEYW